MIYKDARRYKKSLPTKEEFRVAQKILCITKMGRIHPSIVTMPIDERTSINLWNKEIGRDDESQKVFNPFLLLRFNYHVFKIFEIFYYYFSF